MASARGGQQINTEQAGVHCALLAMVFFVLGIVAHGARPAMAWEGVHLDVMLSLVACATASIAVAAYRWRAGIVTPALAVVQGQIFIIWSCFALGWHILGEEQLTGFLELWFRGWLCSAIVCGSGLAWVLLRRRRRRGFDRIRCPDCGYCLVGLPSPRCPECGRAFTPEELGVSASDLQISPPSSTPLPTANRHQRLRDAVALLKRSLSISPSEEQVRRSKRAPR